MGYDICVMKRHIVITALVAAFAASSAAALPQSGGNAGAKAKAAQMATQQAKAVTYRLRDRSSGLNVGSVTLSYIGSTRSRVRVTLANPARTAPTLTLRPGRDCQEPRVANAPHSILLNPFTGRVSETIVSLPLTNLQSGQYLLDVRNATARQQAIDACARLAQ